MVAFTLLTNFIFSRWSLYIISVKNIKLFLFFVDEPEEKFIQPKFKPVGPIKSAQSKGRPIWD